MSVQAKEQVLSLIRSHQCEIKNLGVKRLGLFGSFVRGEQNAESDVDMLVEFEAGKKSFDAFMNLAFFLEDLFERRVELVTLESLSPFISPHVLEEIEYVSFEPSVSATHSERNSLPDGAS
ncbi:MAG: nucleotidyltransferase family protein [Chloroflexi bacterium]|nr:nucleotidyltransferase family protein [Chloroflexota bacterium]